MITKDVYEYYTGLAGWRSAKVLANASKHSLLAELETQQKYNTTISLTKIGAQTAWCTN